ncbi:MAG: S41 family peptidase [Chloroflexi bacterium]|nr:S41 family peptidase [Chloroflexota bacterium]
MNNWQKWAIAALLIVLLTTTAFAAGFGVGRYVVPPYLYPTQRTAEKQQEQLRIFWEAWQIIEDKFYSEEPLDFKSMAYGAIRGMVSSLGDPHTVFLTAEQANVFHEDLEGEFGGIGVTVNMTEEGYLQVVKLIPGAPAEKTSLKPGDIILEVDGKSIQGLDMAQAISLIRGPKGTQVRLLIKHPEGETEEITITRAIVEIPTVESRMLDHNIAYLRLWEFNARATALVRESLKELLGKNPSGLVLDLRGNPGGYLHIVVQIASEFIPEGTVLIERNSNGQETRHSVSGLGIATQIPLAVLVDKGSASAAEILAGAIQDHKRGVLIGERTFGKGSVQITERLSDQSALQVTIQRWYTPANRAIEGQGLTPDIEVGITAEDWQAQRDPQLERAIAYLLSQAP